MRDRLTIKEVRGLMYEFLKETGPSGFIEPIYMRVPDGVTALVCPYILIVFENPTPSGSTNPYFMQVPRWEGELWLFGS